MNEWGQLLLVEINFFSLHFYLVHEDVKSEFMCNAGILFLCVCVCERILGECGEPAGMFEFKFKCFRLLDQN